MTGIEPRRCATADEVDAHSGWRRVLYWRPGERAKIKRLTNRRERRERQRDTTRRVREQT